MNTSSEPLVHPIFWIIMVLTLISILAGFGSNIADRAFGPDEEKARRECRGRAHAEKESCLNGGALNGMFKTSKRIKTCDEIYQREIKACEG